ncbi:MULTISPECIES: helix-turn-helix domain-containing protein [Clostridia]|uniref:Helix-turn-helix domain-containing protein n=1 Tax=Clostridium neonatale TaxID=137838 RepID=A0AAD2DDT3_9CLOT|nr:MULTISPECIES: helix-turn-helix domain-containing protein [Clostridiaceae]MBS5955119.1 helix-turn-helix domain-containing protein [Paraclostridium bifermentans]CAI3193884.1 Conserved hypothetical protein [Clostridium neonatale]CAI3198248.1 Conserved hypothetical protein [Clostridium neonatale]CAI3208096.1 Conserved hypothetical protein [Clostridium neonatale]CAI3235266.1 Conserved hypothetical protein [Clostridium neonatale]
MSEIAREEVKVANEEVKEELKKLILTPEETREILGFSKNTIYDILANDDTFPAFRIGVRWFINADKLQEWIDSMTNKR